MNPPAVIEPGRIPLFDLDGVLIDSSASAARHWSQFAAQYGLDPIEIIARIPGRRAIDSVREFIPHAPEVEIVAAAAAQEQAALVDHEGVVAIPGASELLRSLGPRGWAIVTSSPRDLARVRLDATGLPLPPVLVAAEDVTAGKPDPEPYLRAAARLHVEPPSCTVFEDALPGIAAARAAGMRVIALATSHPYTELAGAADAVIADLTVVTVDPGG